MLMQNFSVTAARMSWDPLDHVACLPLAPWSSPSAPATPQARRSCWTLSPCLPLLSTHFHAAVTKGGNQSSQ